MSFTFCLKFPDCRAALNWILVTTNSLLQHETSTKLNSTDSLLQHETSTKLKKLVNGRRISIRNVPIGKKGLSFQNFRLSRKFSSGTNQKIVYHLHPKQNFREFVVNGKQPICLTFGRYQAFFLSVVQRMSIILQLPTEMGDRYGFLVIIFYMLFLGLFYSMQ